MRTTVAERGLRVVPGRFARDNPPAARENHLTSVRNRDDFQRIFLPHLDAAYNLARWLLKNDADAQDVVQEAFLRALRFSGGFRGGDARAWLLAIVRNAAYSFIARKHPAGVDPNFDEGLRPEPSAPPDIEAIRRADARALHAALDQLPAEFREMIVLRDLEELSYKEMAAVADLPIGTVMSRLARARARLKAALGKSQRGDAK